MSRPRSASLRAPYHARHLRHIRHALLKLPPRAPRTPPVFLGSWVKPHWAYAPALLPSHSAYLAWSYLLGLLSLGGLALRRLVLSLGVVTPLDASPLVGLANTHPTPPTGAPSHVVVAWLSAAASSAPSTGALRASFWPRFTTLAELLPVTYRVIFIGLSRRVRKIVRNRFRFRRQFVCVPPHARLAQGFRLMRLCLRFVEGRTWPSRLHHLLATLFVDPTQSPVLLMRARQQTHVLATLRRQYLFA